MPGPIRKHEKNCLCWFCTSRALAKKNQGKVRLDSDEILLNPLKDENLRLRGLIAELANSLGAQININDQIDVIEHVCACIDIPDPGDNTSIFSIFKRKRRPNRHNKDSK